MRFSRFNERKTTFSRSPPLPRHMSQSRLRERNTHRRLSIFIRSKPNEDIANRTKTSRAVPISLDSRIPRSFLSSRRAGCLSCPSSRLLFSPVSFVEQVRGCVHLSHSLFFLPSPSKDRNNNHRISQAHPLSVLLLLNVHTAPLALAPFFHPPVSVSALERRGSSCSCLTRETGRRRLWRLTSARGWGGGPRLRRKWGVWPTGVGEKGRWAKKRRRRGEEEGLDGASVYESWWNKQRRRSRPRRRCRDGVA